MTALLSADRLVGVGMKMYFDRPSASAWLEEVATVVGSHPAVREGRVGVFVLPAFPSIPVASAALEGTPVAWGAQDLAWAELGPWTGEVSGVELAQWGCAFVEVGHAERRRHFGEDDEIVAAKTAAALVHGLVPVVCVGEPARITADEAAIQCVRQLEASLAVADRDGSLGPIIVAYEPVWAIGVADPAGSEHIRTVAEALRQAVAEDPRLVGSRILYGGSAGAGLFDTLGPSVDGLFLGRAAHDVRVLEAVVEEADRGFPMPFDRWGRRTAVDDR